MADEKEEQSEFHTDTNAGDDAIQGTVAEQDAEGTAPARDEYEDGGSTKKG